VLLKLHGKIVEKLVRRRRRKKKKKERKKLEANDL
jgi:hypothetical protein